MIPIGYLAKRIASRPEWLKSGRVTGIYSVSSHISENFADYIQYWRHNGYWLFNSPAIIRELAEANSINLAGTHLFYYEAHDQEFDDKTNQWSDFQPEASLTTQVLIPARKVLEGYDVVTFFAGSSPECSPLSCNGLADEITTNQHCLLDSFQDAINLLASGKFYQSEPGPFRIFAVYTVEWPKS